MPLERIGQRAREGGGVRSVRNLISLHIACFQLLIIFIIHVHRCVEYKADTLQNVFSRLVLLAFKTDQLQSQSRRATVNASPPRPLQSIPHNAFLLDVCFPQNVTQLLLRWCQHAAASLNPSCSALVVASGVREYWTRPLGVGYTNDQKDIFPQGDLDPV